VNAAEFQKLANERIADAKVLLVARRWSATYYLAGYAVECALKSCVLARVTAEAEVIFDDRRFSEKCWTHDLAQLVTLANLHETLKDQRTGEAEFLQNWDIVTAWNEWSRYEISTRNEAEELYEAITNKKHGVLPWVKQCW